MTRNSLRGILFDMDGVLCDSGPFLYAASAHLFKERYGVSIRPEDVRPYFGRGEVAYLTGTGKTHGIDISLPGDLEHVYEHYFSTIRGAIKPFDGVTVFVDRAQNEGMKLAVASSADRRKVMANLVEIGLPPERFDTVVTVEDVALPKPAPDIFQTAARRLGLDPEQCLVIEDAVSGIHAGKAAGCTCLGITTGFTSDELMAAGADFVLSMLRWDDVMECLT
jgi:beta-phosphoglucomutase